jgi:hypothetical protein
MLTIGNDQMEVLQRYVDNRFVHKLAQDIRTHHAEVCQGLSEERLLRMVEMGIARARKHDLTGTYQIAMFVELMFLVGPDFDEYPPVRFLLAGSQITANARLDRLLDTMTEQQWAGAKRRSNPNAWGT